MNKEEEILKIKHVDNVYNKDGEHFLENFMQKCCESQLFLDDFWRKGEVRVRLKASPDDRGYLLVLKEVDVEDVTPDDVSTNKQEENEQAYVDTFQHEADINPADRGIDAYSLIKNAANAACATCDEQTREQCVNGSLCDALWHRRDRAPAVDYLREHFETICTEVIEKKFIMEKMTIVEKILEQIDDNRDCKWKTLVETNLKILNDQVHKLQSAISDIQASISSSTTE